jgi:hypothetical protein
MIWRTNPTQAFADALAGSRPAEGEVADLVAVATRLCEIAATAEPSPEFRSALRTQLLATPIPVSAPAAFVARTRRTPSGLHRWTIAFAALMATTFGVGLSAASADTIPGDTLYPIKRALENTQLAFKRTDSSSGSFHLHLATERLAEVQTLASLNGTASALTTDTLAEFQRQASLGSDALLRSYLTNKSRADLVALNRFSASSSHRLAGLRGQLSAADLAETQNLLDGLAVQSTRMCPECGGSIATDTARETHTVTAPTNMPTPTTATSTSSADSDSGSGSTTPSSDPAAHSADAPELTTQVPTSLPKVAPEEKQPPVPELLQKSIDVPAKPLADANVVKKLTEHGEKLQQHLPGAH